MFQLKYEILLTQVYMIQELIRIYVVFDIACGQFKKNDLQQQKSHTKNVSLSLIFSVISYCIYILVSEIDIKYTFLVRFHIFHKTIDYCDVIGCANMENCYQNSSWGKGLIISRNNESYTFHL